MGIPKANEVYRHFKGNMYQIVTLAQHSETDEELVIYQALYGEGKTYARPLVSFMEKLSKEKYPEAPQEFRFEKVEAKESVDPGVMKFLDAETYGEKLEILDSMKEFLTDDMINTMSIACDIEVEEGDLGRRFESLRNCLMTFHKFESTRLR